MPITDIRNMLCLLKLIFSIKFLLVAQFMYIIRKRIQLPPEKAMFLFVNKVLPTTRLVSNTSTFPYTRSLKFVYQAIGELVVFFRVASEFKKAEKNDLSVFAAQKGIFKQPRNCTVDWKAKTVSLAESCMNRNVEL